MNVGNVELHFEAKFRTPGNPYVLFFYIGCIPKESIIISATYSTLIAFPSSNSPLFGKVTVRLKNPTKSCLSGLWPSKYVKLP